MFFNFYVVKIHKIAKNPTTAGTRGKLSTHLEALKFKFSLCMFDLIQIQLNFTQGLFTLATFVGDNASDSDT